MQLFDHLVGRDLQCERNGKAERLRSTQVDHQLEPGRLQDSIGLTPLSTFPV